MARPEYTASELKTMQLMAHGVTREEISSVTGLSLSTVARIARDATDKAVAPGAPIVQGIATMVAEGSISVPARGQKATARETALHWLETRIMSAVDWREVQHIRRTYKEMTETAKEADA